MSIKIGRVTLHITLLFAIFFALAANFTGGKNILLSFLFSFIHETVHIICLCFSGCKNIKVTLLPAAVKINCEGLSLLANKRIIICSLSAPVFNIFAGAVFYCLSFFINTEFMKLSSVINLILGGINLFPLSFLDGGRALTAVLSGKYDENRVKQIMKALAVWSVALLFAVFFISCLVGKMQIFLLFFCVYCFFGVVTDKS